ncbi:hypothetical protein QNS29_002733 [Vibrio parahaemolyticus]|nr:hypothetical protein [Vibrio parahaemolyticus]
MLKLIFAISLMLLASCTTSGDESTSESLNAENEKVARATLFNGFQLTPYPSTEFGPGYVFYIDRKGSTHKIGNGRNLVLPECQPSLTPKLETNSSTNLSFGLNWLLGKYNGDASTAFSKGVNITADPQKSCTASFDGLVQQANYIQSLRQEVAEAASIDPIFNVEGLYLVTEAIETADFKVTVHNHKETNGKLGVDVKPVAIFNVKVDDSNSSKREFYFENQEPKLFVFMKLLRVKLGSGANGETKVSFEKVNEPI